MIDKLTDIIRVGKVSAIDAQTCKAKITFEDRDDNVSGFLFITVPCTLKDKFYYMPSLGERVTVVYNPDAPSNGRIIGSFYADNRLPPFPDENKFYINFEDNTLLEYDKKLNKLTIKIAAENETSVEVETASDIIVKSNGKVSIDIAKEIIINAGSDTIINVEGAAQFSCAGDITVNAEANTGVNIAGSADINVNGGTSINISGETNITSSDNMTVQSEKTLTLKGMESSIRL